MTLILFWDTETRLNLCNLLVRHYTSGKSHIFFFDKESTNSSISLWNLVTLLGTVYDSIYTHIDVNVYFVPFWKLKINLNYYDDVEHFRYGIVQLLTTLF